MAEKYPLLGDQPPSTYRGGHQGYNSLQRRGYPQTGGYPEGYHQVGGYPQGSEYPQRGGRFTYEQGGVTHPSAPPRDNGFDSVTEYYQTNNNMSPPFNPELRKEQAPIGNSSYASIPRLSEDDAQDALLSHISQNCCWRARPAKKMQINDMQHSPAFHYKLETFTERRETSWEFEPFIGQPVDGPEKGSAPRPWDIVVSPNQYFKNSSKKVELPHTASVKDCHDCIAKGFQRCSSCVGKGRESDFKTQCEYCRGLGTVRRRATDVTNRSQDDDHMNIDRDCPVCNRVGFIRCKSCKGRSKIRCSTCDGRCKLKSFTQVKVTWTNNFKDYVVERTGLPDELIRTVRGKVFFKEDLPMVSPINNLQDKYIKNASQRLIADHLNAFPSMVIIRQRHQVSVIPVTYVTCQLDKRRFSYFVYGFENRVHAPDYPAQCCCTVT